VAQVIDQTIYFFCCQFIFSGLSCGGLTIRTVKVTIISGKPLDKSKRLKESKLLEEKTKMTLKFGRPFKVVAIDDRNFVNPMLNLIDVQSFPSFPFGVNLSYNRRALFPNPVRALDSGHSVLLWYCRN
jgi:hypothetical protein